MFHNEGRTTNKTLAKAAETMLDKTLMFDERLYRLNLETSDIDSECPRINKTWRFCLGTFSIVMCSLLSDTCTSVWL